MTKWDDVFDFHGIKQVSPNDKIKHAYVPSKEQKGAIEAAGLIPADGGPAPQSMIRVLGEPTRTHVGASYYRAKGHPDREPRFGREFISKWLHEGDRLLVGVRDQQLFVAKVHDAETHQAILDDLSSIGRVAHEDELPADVEFDAEDAKILAAPLNPEALELLREKYKDASPVVKTRLSTHIERGGIGSEVKRVNGYHCQICRSLGLPSLGFQKRSGDRYVEAHHVMPVSALVAGSLGPQNVISVCPNHHRQIHYGNVAVVELPQEFVFTIDGAVVRVSRN